MSEQRNRKISIHIVIVAIITIACIGLVAESISEGWEFWVTPLLIAGVITCWLLHITQYGEDRFRENFYFVFAIIAAFFHGMHESSIFDTVVISALTMVTFSLLNRAEMLKILLAEYLVIMTTQLILAYSTKNTALDALNISKIGLDVAADICIFYVCTISIKFRAIYVREMEEFRQERLQAGKDTEDFLSNISHELRTPVNVVNGMSSLILKKENREDVASIRDAGVRLSNQIEDIKDYTEIVRKEILLEEDKYMITSLLNDVLASYENASDIKDLELVIDLDPLVPMVLEGDIKKIHKIIRHVLDNAVKFTRTGGIYVRISSIKREYGINLIFEVKDTGIGMSRKELSAASKGLYQANKKRNRSTGGIGLGLTIVMGFVHAMNGFVTIESERKKGTRVKISIPQSVVDSTACLDVDRNIDRNIVFYVIPEKYNLPEIREFYQQMAVHFAQSLGLNLYSADSVREIENLKAKYDITHIFMGEEEYERDPEYFDNIASQGTVVAISADQGYEPRKGSRVIVMQKPLYGFPVAKVLNGSRDIDAVASDLRPDLSGIRALIVDDEPMNLVVASGLFKDYDMETDTAGSGKEAIKKFTKYSYDVIFMDHMMPEMDGVETMKKIKDISFETGKKICVIALTANVVSGAKEMFIKEGFDGFISKPINITDFERTMTAVLPEILSGKEKRSL